MRYDTSYCHLIPPCMKNTFTSFELSDCTLRKNRIDIWQYPLHTEFAGAKALLSEAELTRANRYHFPRHQRRFTVARATLRLILARYLQLPATDLLFSYNKHGKPEIEHPSLLQFNLSHSGDLALLAVGQRFPVGIDLEFFSARPYEGIGKHLFSTHENKKLEAMPPMLQALAFFHIWSQKEAFIKACGLGLAYPTERFDVPIFAENAQDIVDPLYHNTWKMLAFMPQIACSAAVCYHSEIQNIRYITLDDQQQKDL